MAYMVNIIVACQFDDSGWDYLDEPIYRKNFDTMNEAVEAYFDMGGIDKNKIANEYRSKFPECKAFEIETTISEDGDYAFADGCEWFDNERIWTADGWEF